MPSQGQQRSLSRIVSRNPASQESQRTSGDRSDGFVERDEERSDASPESVEEDVDWGSRKKSAARFL